MQHELAKKTANHHPSASFSATLRVHLENQPGSFARLAAAIGDAGGLLGAIDLVRVERGKKVRDVTVLADDEGHIHRIVDAVRALPGIEVEHVSDRTFLLHLGGKLEVVPKAPLKTRDDLSMAYTPGVARVCRAIADDPDKVWNLTIKQNTVAVVTDGTAVLGLGDIGPEAALPVMEGKAILFKEFGGIDAWPVCLDTTDPDEIVRIVAALAPALGGINLEDISAPRCFEIEERLREDLNIPVFHDDQHGTAIVVLAALLNALRVVGKQLADVRVVLTGAGAAGAAGDAPSRLLPPASPHPTPARGRPMTRQSPRWARRGVAGSATDPDSGREPEMVRREQRRIVDGGPVECQATRNHRDVAADPDVVQATRLALGVHPRRLDAGRPGHRRQCGGPPRWRSWVHRPTRAVRCG